MTASANGTMSKPPVLLIGKFLDEPRSTPRVCKEFASRLVDLGWPVLTTSHKTTSVPMLVDMLSTVWLKRNEYEVAHVDVFSGHAFVWAEATCMALKLLGKPYVLTLRGGNLPNFARRWPRRTRNVLDSAALVTTPSSYLLERMVPYRSDMILQSNPINLADYDFHHRSSPQPKLIWLRRFCEIYNPSLAPKVIAELVPDFPSVDITMFGPDWGDGSLQRMKSVARSMAVETRIHLPGRVAKSAIAGAMNQGDIFLNTTNVDNTPISVLEAMACGLCVVSTNAGGIPYLLEDERDALLVPPDDAQAMSNAVHRILTEPGLAKSLSENARKKVEQFDWSAILPRWEQLFNQVAQQYQSEKALTVSNSRLCEESEP